MQVEFANGVVIGATQVSEERKVYSEPKKWELKIISDTDLSSDDLDVLLCRENINKITHTLDNGSVATIKGYNKVEKVYKVSNAGGVSLIIILQKELV